MQFETSAINWEAQSVPLFFYDYRGELVRAGTSNAVVRMDTLGVLGNVSTDYQVFQNSELYGKIQPLESEGLVEISNIGELRGGKQVYIQAKINKDYTVVGESYQGFITMTNFHTGLGRAGLGMSCVRIVCENTFAAAQEDLLKFSHVGDGKEEFLNSRVIADFVDGEMGVYARNAETLASEACSAGRFQEFLKGVYQKDELDKIRNVDRLNALFYEGAGNEGRTMYDALNAVTEYSSHFSRKEADSRFKYVNFGEGSKINSRAMEVALAMV
ncbi:putative alpha/beta hydrolase [Synechococcus phage S-CBWM1]|uniref:Putative alpha/beta hydrolase n=1 Tax=Synechococcus phage S-CBWM1 TaxID=2053653 RepID=A0A3G1L3H1_9CAUD|nr:putative alpha/beta hydrolase [Synechococcus phage S-CBWM1]ATW62726.1 putative alpha/beta hydrolase [Synechococcus phage S-CBWM1]